MTDAKTEDNDTIYHLHGPELHYLSEQAGKFPDRRELMIAIAMLSAPGYLNPTEREILQKFLERINRVSTKLDVEFAKKRKKRED